MSNVIRLLPDHVANQIAAGEVVQRPASVVKELMENSVDAGATEIKLILKDAGKTLIQVIDNGKGMSETDARMAFERHATSKITSAEDLFSLNTKGFRGEALASIAAIAHVELKTRQLESELGTNIIIEGSKIISQEVAVVPKGTSFSVKNLFFNIPARRNFLKSNTVEFRHVIDEFERIALAHNNINFILIHNGSEMFNLPPSNFRKRIVNIFGSKTNEKLVPVQEVTDIVGINGFVGKPEFAKKNRREQFFFVNDRFIKSGYLHHAVLSAFEGLLKDGTYPSYFLYLDLPPNTIDINIHPTKTEIKFDDEQALYAILRSAVKHSLGQFSVAPVLDFQKDESLETPYDFKDKQADTPSIQIDTNFNPFLDDKISFKSNLQSGDKSFSNLKSTSSGGSFSNKKDILHSGFSKPDSSGSWETLYEGLKSSSNDIDISGLNIEQDVESVSLFEGFAEEHSHKRSFQIKGKYIVNPIKSGLVIIDQKRAHQRILYEKFLANITVTQASSQQLLFPLTMYYGSYEIELLKEMEGTLKQIGFVFESIDSEKLIISGLPTGVSESEVSIVLEDLINDLQGELSQNSFSQTDRISKSLANSLAVKTGTILNEEEQENIVNSLFACKEASVSPFLKPTFITISIEDIDKKFTL